MQPLDEPQATVKPVAIPEIVTLPCEVDITNASRLGRELIGAFGTRATVVIADMSLTDFCDSSGMRQLLIANDAAKASGGELRVVVRSAMVLRVMQTLGIDGMLRIYSSMGEALAGRPDSETEREGAAVARFPHGAASSEEQTTATGPGDVAERVVQALEAADVSVHALPARVAARVLVALGSSAAEHENLARHLAELFRSDLLTAAEATVHRALRQLAP